jgi:hypothetical protein
MSSESPRDDWSTLASALTSDRRVMFVDDGHRTSHELVEGPDPRRSSDKCATAGAFVR